MGYKKAAQVLLKDLLAKVQKYVDGEFLYIPRAADNKKCWGETTTTRREIKERNRQIYADYVSFAKMVLAKWNCRHILLLAKAFL